MKRFLSIILVAVIIFALAACNTMQTAEKFCSSCGKGIPKSATFCEHCGAAVGDTKKENEGNLDGTENTESTGAKVGEYIKFGFYEQDNDTSNGTEEIEWLVIEVKDDKALVISKYALDYKQYNTSEKAVTWETCSLRKWLNNDFINAAFSTYEKAMIPTVTVSADKNPSFDTKPGRATQDKIFLLSITEVEKYLSSIGAGECWPTDYTTAKGEEISISSGQCLWWLRTPGNEQSKAAYVGYLGAAFEFGGGVDYLAPVRPAMWIDLGAIE